jgi:hypothetical protein
MLTVCLTKKMVGSIFGWPDSRTCLSCSRRFLSTSSLKGNTSKTALTGWGTKERTWVYPKVRIVRVHLLGPHPYGGWNVRTSSSSPYTSENPTRSVGKPTWPAH